jgi:hypothetical protein
MTPPCERGVMPHYDDRPALWKESTRGDPPIQDASMPTHIGRHAAPQLFVPHYCLLQHLLGVDTMETFLQGEADSLGQTLPGSLRQFTG